LLAIITREASAETASVTETKVMETSETLSATKMLEVKYDKIVLFYLHWITKPMACFHDGSWSICPVELVLFRWAYKVLSSTTPSSASDPNIK